MTEEAKRQFNPYKYLCFPWGAIPLTPIWFAITEILDNSIIANISFTAKSGEVISAPWWCFWVIFIIGEFFIFAFLAFYSYILPKGKKDGHNIYILITPENHSDDKYITDDFVDGLKRHTHGSVGNFQIIVLPIIKREVFNRTISRYQQKHKDFWKSKRWKKQHKRMKGSLYISGTLKKRQLKGKENYVFTLSATVGYNNVNKDITPMMIDELQKNFPPRILIDKEVELEGFEAMSDNLATFSEYVIGWANLVSGRIELAFRMHNDIYSNNKQSFLKRGALNKLPELLRFEIDNIFNNCKIHPMELITNCIQLAEQLFPGSDTATISTARALLMKCTNDSEFESIVSQAQRCINMARINKSNRDIVHADRAYIFLLKNDYLRAEDEYNSFFKRAKEKTIDSIIEYCNIQIKDGCSKERPTAYYVRALMSLHSKKQNDLDSIIMEAKSNISADNIYLHKKLEEMETKSKSL